MDGVTICPSHFEEQIAHLASVLLYSFNDLWEGSTVEKKLQFELSRFGLVQLRQVTTNFIVRTEGCPVVVEVGSSGFQSWTNKKDVGEITLWSCNTRVEEETERTFSRFPSKVSGKVVISVAATKHSALYNSFLYLVEQYLF